MDVAAEESILVGVEFAEIDSHFRIVDFEGCFKLVTRALHARPPTVARAKELHSPGRGRLLLFGGVNIGVQTVSRTGVLVVVVTARPAGLHTCENITHVIRLFSESLV